MIDQLPEQPLHPACPRCMGAVEETARAKIIEVEDEGGGSVRVRFVFCGACGTALTSAILAEGA